MGATWNHDRDLTARSAESGHEVSDINSKRVARVGLALATVIALALLVTYGLFHYFYSGETRTRPLPSPLSYSREPTPEPRLSVEPGEELKTLRSEEDAMLKSYGWIDRDKGVVRIPIDRAIEILAERGLPAPGKKRAGDRGKSKSKRGKKTLAQIIRDRVKVRALASEGVGCAWPALALKRALLRALGLVFALILALALARAHDNTRPAALREVAFDQKLAEQVPLDLSFRDERGNEVRLSDYFGRKPVIVNFVYYKCRDLCPLLLDGLVRSLRALSFDIGNQFAVLTVSFDPHDSAALADAKNKEFLARYARPGAADGWHFLTGTEDSIRKTNRAVGFHYNYDAQTGEFAHATGIVLLTPAGKISRYYYGIDFSPRDLRLGLIEAAEARSVRRSINCCSFAFTTIRSPANTVFSSPT